MKNPVKKPAKKPVRKGVKKASSRGSVRPLALEVLFSMEVRDVSPPVAGWLEDKLRLAAAAAGVGGEVSILVVGDRKMAQLHVDYKRVAGTTDCLTFDLSGPHTPKGHVEGDLVLCLPEARRQAKVRGHDAREELLLYAIHGLLHLDGEDDLEPAAFARMHKREDAILKKIGMKPLFHGA